MKMIDKNNSKALCKAEFEKLCRKVLKKEKDIKPTEELFSMLWRDVCRHCKDPNQTEIADTELCVWLELKMDKPGTKAAAKPVEKTATSAAKPEAKAEKPEKPEKPETESTAASVPLK